MDRVATGVPQPPAPTTGRGTGASAPRDCSMSKTLFIASTPLHVFFSLGLMRGPFRDDENTLALIDQRPGDRDYVAEALEAEGGSPRVVRFPTLRALGHARTVLAQISDFTRGLAPSTLAVGNDRRTEFYAALRGCPGARRTYVDDGLYSYLPREDAHPAWRQAISNWRRSLKYGLELERPDAVGASRAVQDAYVLLPDQVHEGLRGKPVEALRPEWFADPWVRQVCRAAAARAGFDVAACGPIGLLLLLPHPRFLQDYPALRRGLETLARDHAARGSVVAVKPHPRAVNTPLERQLELPRGRLLEMPARLPIEVLVPLLSGTRVVGSLTTALLSLVLLGDRLSVRCLPPPQARGAGQRYNERAYAIYRSVGIEPIDEAA